MTQPFDSRSLVLSGTTIPVADRILINDGSGAGAFTVSGTGLVLFQATARKVLRPRGWIEQADRWARSANPTSTLDVVGARWAIGRRQHL